jgi:hypothetical protein
MTQEELDIIESARSWISADANASDSVRTSNQGYDLADALDNIIQKYRNIEK